MIEAIKVNTPEGLHGTNLSTFIDCATRFYCTISVECDGRRANAKSLMGMLTLSVMPNSTVKLIADGPDAEEAVAWLKELICTNFLSKQVIERIHAHRP